MTWTKLHCLWVCFFFALKRHSKFKVEKMNESLLLVKFLKASILKFFCICPVVAEQKISCRTENIAFYQWIPKKVLWRASKGFPDNFWSLFLNKWKSSFLCSEWSGVSPLLFLLIELWYLSTLKNMGFENFVWKYSDFWGWNTEQINFKCFIQSIISINNLVLYFKQNQKKYSPV